MITLINNLKPRDLNKNVFIREEGRGTSVEENNFDLDDTNVIGWFTNKYNHAFGWSLHTLTTDELEYFGSSNVSPDTVLLRTLSCNTRTTSIIKINFKTGTYGFLDNDHFEKTDEVKFERMNKVRSIYLDFPTK